MLRIPPLSCGPLSRGLLSCGLLSCGLVGAAIGQTPQLLTDFDAHFGFDNQLSPTYGSLGTKTYLSLPITAAPSSRTTLIQTDGSSAGTVALFTMPRGSSVDPLRGMVALGSRLVFFGGTRAQRELWVSDGTARGTRSIAGPQLGVDATHLSEEINGYVYFATSLNSNRTEFWRLRHDATAAEFTFSLSTGSILGDVAEFRRLPGTARFVFTMSSSAHGRELWVSDGTATGTHVLDIEPGVDGSKPQHPIEYRGGLLFSAETKRYGRELYWTDGTAAGTRLFIDGAAAATSFVSGPFAVLGDRVLLASPAGKLFVTDGTAQGTMEVGAKLATPPVSPTQFRARGDRVYFAAGAFGRELWTTDGSDRGTMMLPSSGGWPTAWSNGDRPAFHAHLGRLFFDMTTAATEEDAWTLLPEGGAASRFGAGCASNTVLPDLDATTPRVGRELEFRTSALPTPSFGIVVLGAGDFLGTPVVASCRAFVELRAPLVVIDAWAGNANAHTSKLMVPQDVALIGASAAAQTWNLRAAGDLALSNGVHLLVGR